MGIIGRKYPKLQDDEKQELVKLINDGAATKDQKEKLIESYVPLVIALSKKFPKAVRDELLCVGLLALVEAVEIVKLTYIENFSGYVNRTVFLKMKMYHQLNGLIRIKDRSCKTGKINTWSADEFESIDMSLRAVDVDDFVDSIVKTRIEGIVIEQLRKGYRIKEIAEKCKCTSAHICKVKFSLLERLLRL